MSATIRDLQAELKTSVPKRALFRDGVRLLRGAEDPLIDSKSDLLDSPPGAEADNARVGARLAGRDAPQSASGDDLFGGLEPLGDTRPARLRAVVGVVAVLGLRHPPVMAQGIARPGHSVDWGIS